MCGIAGFAGRFDPALLAAMNARLAHRGPDDEGQFLDPGREIGLAHRRLAVIEGIEIRTPLLDTDLVEFAARVPPRLKQRGLRGKYLLRRAMTPLLPRDIVHRPKTGFGVPLRRWMRCELREMTDEPQSPTALERRGIFDPEAVQALVRADRAGRSDGAFLTFAVVCLELWCRLFLDDARPSLASPVPTLRDAAWSGSEHPRTDAGRGGTAARAAS